MIAGDTFKIPYEASDTISTLKQKISTERRISLSSVSLYCGPCLLTDDTIMVADLLEFTNSFLLELPEAGLCSFTSKKEATSIIKIETLQGAVCMIAGAAKATGFLVKLPTDEIAFMTAGHVLDEVISGVTSFDKYEVFFGNIAGEENAVNAERAGAKCFTLGDFDQIFKLRGSIANNGQRLIIPKTKGAETVHRDWDFCVLVLDDADTEVKLKDMGLDWLTCGEGGYLDFKKGNLVSIVGHPGDFAREGALKERRPLRMSVGKERKKKKGPSAPDLLYYDYDTLGGSSGSPVFGRGCYNVKGIHVAGESSVNIAQGLKSLSWMISP